MISRIPGGIAVAKRLRSRAARRAICLAAGVLGATAALASPTVARVARASIPSCLPGGDGYLRARIGGSIDATLHWPNRGTWCAGEPKRDPRGVRMSFRRASGAKPRLLFLFGLTGVREGAPLRDGRINLTVIDESDGRVFGTLGDRRCTIDSLTQRRLTAAHTYRVEVHGFCTEPARAVRGRGEILVSRFDFAGPVDYAAR